MTADGGASRLLPQFIRSIEETKPFIISSNTDVCSKPGAETLVGENDSEYVGCQGKAKSGNTCLKWDFEYAQEKGEVSAAYGTDGGHNYCRNPKASQPSIWCYTGNKEFPTIEKCDPIGVVPQDLCVNSNERLIGVKDDGYRGCQDTTVTGKTC